MLIKDLLQGIKTYGASRSLLDKNCVDVTCQSQNAVPETLFVAIRGEAADGHDYVPQALAQGAVCMIDKRSGRAYPDESRIIRAENTRFAFSLLASRFFDYPSRDVKVIGITGTNGKTTTSYLIRHVFNHFSSCGLVGTIEYRVGSQIIPSKNTTPSAYDLNWMLTLMKRTGMKHCAMEVSSHALEQDRVSHLYFDAAVFTNLTQDHLDYHKDFDSYFAAKKKLFIKTPRPKQIYVNADDAYGRKLLAAVPSRAFSFGIGNRSDYLAHDIEVGLADIRFKIKAGRKSYPVEIGLSCLHNVYNVLGAFAAAHGQGWNPEDIAYAFRSFPGVPGRMERVNAGQDFFVFVDYAHSPDAFQNVLSSVKRLTSKRIITVFGCGGDRDRTKRPIMGRVASQFSDTVVITSDNPRTENPESILDEIETGVITEGKEIYRIPDRTEAIAHALSRARS